MRAWHVLLLACTGALLCALQPSAAMPYVVQPRGGGSGTQVVVDEVEEESVLIKERVDAAVPERPEQPQEEQEDGDVGQDLDDVDLQDATTPPHHRCKLRACWRSCQRRGYNWGLCLCKKCHCYY
ncbi:Large neutral amino acids transporter small subunit 2 [Frankliniella fusca]|uniref:Large neutral amino acids transporter small subunit 2 n=1 Tax=Frankliniella fusca TaxID=407009 RepID=A0AAE1LS25_9NEOP|nr:Large neutral amino acids transporter small subunit 2 [Frankliniella fusca]